MKKHLYRCLWAFVAIGGMLTSAPAPAQLLATRYQLPARPAPREPHTGTTLGAFMQELKTRYGIFYTFADERLETRPVKPERADSRLEKTLRNTLKPAGLKFRNVRGTYIISDEKAPEPEPLRAAQPGSPTSFAPVTSDSDASSPGPALASLESHGNLRPAPDVRVTGRVTSSDDGKGLPGVSVVVKGTARGTSTDAEGRYRLDAPNSQSVLVFSSVGYATREATVGNQTEINLTLQADVQSLGEVVVVGYGTQRRQDLTGSVASINEQTIKQTPLLSTDQALQGRSAGVQVTQTSGEPGAPISIRIRGGNSINAGNEPLFVVDGYPLTPGSSLNAINPSDIESIDVLKDASATAIYGSRGANGVVIVTTKRGKSGKPVVTLESYYGQQTLRRKIPLLNARQYAELLNEASVNGGKPAPFTPDQVAALGTGTDWQDELYRPAPIANYQVGVRGGTEGVRYAVSGNYFKQEGIVINSGFDRISFRTNLDMTLSRKVKLGTNLLFARTRQRGIEDQADGRGVVNNALAMTPLTPVYNPDGSFTEVDIPQIDIRANPVARALATTDQSIGNRLQGNLFLDYSILNNLVLRVSGGTVIGFNKNNFYVPNTIYEGRSTKGYAQVFSGLTTDWLNENTLTYTKEFGKHRLNVLGGVTLQRFNYEDFRAATQNFSNDVLTFNNLFTGGEPQPPSSGQSQSSLLSYIGRVNYNFGDRYLITLTARSDGSSRFGAGNKRALFPSGAVAWRVSEEAFMKNISFVSDLKLRASAGLTGNQEIGNFQSLAALGPFRYVLGSGSDYAPRVGFSNVRVANPDLRWESTRQVDLGLDVALFAGRITTTLDWYYKRTNDLLLYVPLPVTSGFGSALRNVGETENRGIEWSIGSRNVTGASGPGAFTWSVDFNLTANRNKVLNLGDVDSFFAGSSSGGRKYGNSSIVQVGQPLGSFYGIVADGIFQNQEEVDRHTTTLADGTTKKIQPNAKPGDRRFLDLNKDGAINGSDRTIIGQAQPRFFGGLTNTFGYRGFELTVFVQGVQGASILNLVRPELENVSGSFGNQFATVLERWTPTNPSQTIPRALLVSNTPNFINSTMVEDGSYLRFKTITLAYNLPNALLQRLRLGSLRVYVTGQNLLTFTKYSHYDPEVNTFGADNLSVNTDYGAYPTAKTILGGLTVSF